MHNFQTDDHQLQRLQRTTRIVLWALVSLFFLFLSLKHYVPLGRLTIAYDVKRGSPHIESFASKEPDRLIGTPNKKGSDSKYFQLITKTPLYFDVRVPRPFRQATVTLQYQNPDNQPVIKLGVLQKGASAYAYRDLAFAEPILDNLPEYWDKIQQGDLVLWQKNNELLKLEKKLNEQRQEKLDLFDTEQARQIQDTEEKVKQKQLSNDDLELLKQDLQDTRTTELAALDSQYAVKPEERPKTPFVSISDFLNAKTDPRVTAVYNDELPPRVDLSQYTPSTTPTKVDASLRGQHEIETIIGEGERLRFAFTIQDINRHEGKDDFQVSVWDDGRKVTEQKTTGIGSTLATGKPSKVQTVVVEKEGLPAGLYTLKVNAPDDIFIKQIETAQHLLQFRGMLYPTDNDEYRVLLGEKKTGPTKLVTTGTWLTASTSHSDGLQTITAGNRKITMTQLHTQYRLDGLSGVTTVTVPKNDVLLSTDGVFAFSTDQLLPDIQHYRPLDASVNLNTIDYIIARYPQAKKVGDWLKASATVKGNELYVKKGTIGFIVDAPGLPENNRTLKIRSIRIQLEKEPWTPSKAWTKLKKLIWKK